MVFQQLLLGILGTLLLVLLSELGALFLGQIEDFAGGQILGVAQPLREVVIVVPEFSGSGSNLPLELLGADGQILIIVDVNSGIGGNSLLHSIKPFFVLLYLL